MASCPPWQHSPITLGRSFSGGHRELSGSSRARCWHSHDSAPGLGTPQRRGTFSPCPHRDAGHASAVQSHPCLRPPLRWGRLRGNSGSSAALNPVNGLYGLFKGGRKEDGKLPGYKRKLSGVELPKLCNGFGSHYQMMGTGCSKASPGSQRSAFQASLLLSAAEFSWVL